MIRPSVFFLVLYLAISSASNGQVANNTSLVGTVTDESGKAIVGAKVSAVNEGTGVSYPTTTNDEGYYSIEFILAGVYDISVEQAGFTKVVRKGITVENNKALRTDVTLRVGSTTETLVVEGGAPPISTDDATILETLDNRSVSDLPLNGRDALKLAATTSNVILGPKSDPAGIPPGEDFIGAGQREITNSLTLDGITIMNNLITVTPVTPNADAIEEVQVQNGNYTAQYGSYMGVHVNLVTKSGTNQLHGSLYEFVRNDLFDAHPFFDSPGSSKQPIRINQFGTEVAGPVYLPKLYDGRNKTFFTASYEGLRRISSTTQLDTVPTQAMRQGNFAEICASGFNSSGLCNDPSGQIYNPVSGQPYANNLISSGLSPQAQAILEYYPLPNLPGIANNYNAPVGTSINYNQTLDRIDQTIGDKVRLFFRYDWQNTTIFGGSTNPTGGSYGPTRNRNFAFGYTHIITPSLVNDFRFGRNHLVTNNLDYFFVKGLKDAGTQLGILGFNGDTAFGDPGIPDVNISGFMSAGNAGANWFQDDTTWHGYDQISYTRGKHNIMAGVELRKLTTGRMAVNSPRGVLNFDGSITGCQTSLYACPTDGSGSPISGGFSVADFVVGRPQNDQTPQQVFKGVPAEWRDGFFVLDNWQVNRKLTLNIGLRYELPTVPYSVSGNARILNADQTALIPTTVPDPGFQFIRPNHDNWAPRLGFAYRFTEKTVVRGGGGFYYNPNQTNSFTLATTNPPFGISSSYTYTSSCPLTLDDPIPNGCAGAPSAHPNVFTENPYLPTPRMYQWNLGVERELWKNAGFELQYLGSHSLHLDRSYYNNQPVVLGPGSVQSRRPNQLWGRIRTIQNDEIANYHGLTAIFRQRVTRGIQVLASYTWSHTLDISSDSNDGGFPMNAYDWHRDYGSANWDIRHRFVASFIYDLPGLKNQNWLVRGALGGWQINDITTIQSGTHFDVEIAKDLANVGRGHQRPDLVGKPSAECNAGHLNGCIDSSAFALPAPYTFGNFSRNYFSGPGLVNTDFSLVKNFPIKERAKFQFRAEFFNAFNHPQFANPDGTFGTGSFGTITSTTGDNREIQFGAKFVF